MVFERRSEQTVVVRNDRQFPAVSTNSTLRLRSRSTGGEPLHDFLQRLVGDGPELVVGSVTVCASSTGAVRVLVGLA